MPPTGSGSPGVVPPPRFQSSNNNNNNTNIQQQQQPPMAVLASIVPSPTATLTSNAATSVCTHHSHGDCGTLPAGIASRGNSSSKPPLSIIKFLELCLAATCTVLHYYSFDDGDLVTGFLSTGTFCGYIVILTTVMVGYLMKAHIHRRLNLFYSLLGCALFLTSGVFIIEAWEHAFRTRTRDLAITKGSIAIINGVIFMMDTIFTFRERK
ncbi:uncharacterized protein LOC129758196 [Uranotaenia lowii]|uniref:uncharacterized protein LOC129758196 n=1 Tax=Uranotaenia lowii TaxID=190385 RepID=UPI0024797F57|nr:uncharacterized protein LOC129758196 [Uranotaenia lowii]